MQERKIVSIKGLIPLALLRLSAVWYDVGEDPSYMIHYGGAYYKLNLDPNPIINP